MEHLDKLIPLVILGAVGAFLVFLVRRVARDVEVAPRARESVARVEVKPEPVQIELPIAAPAVVVQEVAPVPVLASVADEPVAPSRQPVALVERQRTKKLKPAPTAVTVIPAETPIEAVLGLLKEKDGLAVAFVLREILAPPVSKR